MRSLPLAVVALALLLSGCLGGAVDDGDAVSTQGNATWSLRFSEMTDDVPEAGYGSGRTISSTNYTISSVEWRHRLEGELRSLRRHGEHRLLVVTGERILDVDRRTGTLRHAIRANGTVLDPGFYATTHALDDDRQLTNRDVLRNDGGDAPIYVRRNGTYLRYDPTDGRLVTVADTPMNDPATERPVRGGLLVRGDGGRTFFLNASTGRTRSYGTGSTGAMAIGPDGRLYHGDGEMIVARVPNGSSRTVADLGSRPNESLSPVTDRIDPSRHSAIQVYGVTDDAILFGLFQEEANFAQLYLFDREERAVRAGPRAIDGNDVMMARPRLTGSRYRFATLDTHLGDATSYTAFVLGEYDAAASGFRGIVVERRTAPSTDGPARWDVAGDHVFAALRHPATDHTAIVLHRYGTSAASYAVAPPRHGSIEYVVPSPENDSWILANDTAVFEAALRRGS